MTAAYFRGRRRGHGSRPRNRRAPDWPAALVPILARVETFENDDGIDATDEAAAAGEALDATLRARRGPEADGARLNPRRMRSATTRRRRRSREGVFARRRRFSRVSLPSSPPNYARRRWCVRSSRGRDRGRRRGSGRPALGRSSVATRENATATVRIVLDHLRTARLNRGFAATPKRSSSFDRVADALAHAGEHADPQPEETWASGDVAPPRSRFPASAGDERRLGDENETRWARESAGSSASSASSASLGLIRATLEVVELIAEDDGPLASAKETRHAMLCLALAAAREEAAESEASSSRAEAASSRAEASRPPSSSSVVLHPLVASVLHPLGASLGSRRRRRGGRRRARLRRLLHRVRIARDMGRSPTIVSAARWPWSTVYLLPISPPAPAPRRRDGRAYARPSPRSACSTTKFGSAATTRGVAGTATHPVTRARCAPISSRWSVGGVGR